MNKIILAFLALILFFGCVPGENNTTAEINENPAALEVKGEGEWWMERHQTILSRLTKDPELILIGNSIFHSLDDENRQEVWEKYLDQYRTVNMGISGDRTENVIWRLQNGSLENIHPKVAVILIGTNNTDGNHYLNISTPEELAGGIWKICEIVEEKLPDTKILIMGILPYGYKPNHRDNINKATNSLISKFPEKDPNTHYTDIGHVYLDKEGNVRKELMPDYLHPNPEGHLLMFEALEHDIAGMMTD
jgi:lysophospholipase L1-like esterase